MHISRKLILAPVVIFLTAAQFVTTTRKDEKQQLPQAVVTLMPCALLTADVARGLPWFIKFSDVVCMSVRAEDLQDSEHLAALLIGMGARLQNENSFSHLNAEYDRAMAAYGNGNYAEAISRLREATASGN